MCVNLLQTRVLFKKTKEKEKEKESNVKYMKEENCHYQLKFIKIEIPKLITS